MSPEQQIEAFRRGRQLIREGRELIESALEVADSEEVAR